MIEVQRRALLMPLEITIIVSHATSIDCKLTTV